MNSDKPQPEASPCDVESPDALIKAMYDAISGPKGGRDWNRIRSLYLPGARLVPTGKRVNGETGLRLLDIDGWMEGARPLFETNNFYETQIACRLDIFGKIAQAFSTYECRWEENGEVFARGINCIQMLHKEGRWWLVHVFWDNAEDDNPIPEDYLP